MNVHETRHGSFAKNRVGYFKNPDCSVVVIVPPHSNLSNSVAQFGIFCHGALTLVFS